MRYSQFSAIQNFHRSAHQTTLTILASPYQSHDSRTQCPKCPKVFVFLDGVLFLRTSPSFIPSAWSMANLQDKAIFIALTKGIVQDRAVVISAHLFICKTLHTFGHQLQPCRPYWPVHPGVILEVEIWAQKVGPQVLSLQARSNLCC